MYVEVSQFAESIDVYVEVESIDVYVVYVHGSQSRSLSRCLLTSFPLPFACLSLFICLCAGIF